MACLHEPLLARMVTLGLTLSLIVACATAGSAARLKRWQIGEPIVTYWAGPPMTDAVAEQMKAC